MGDHEVDAKALYHRKEKTIQEKIAGVGLEVLRLKYWEKTGKNPHRRGRDGESNDFQGHTAVCHPQGHSGSLLNACGEISHHIMVNNEPCQIFLIFHYRKR